MLSKFVSFQSSAENRDKILKMLQNWELLRSYMLLGIDNKKSEQNFEIYQQIYVFRRLFRLGKSLQTILNILQKQQMQNLKKHFHQIPYAVNEMSTYSVYVFYFFFHLLENIMVIHQMGFFEKKFNHQLLKILSHSFWTLGLLTQLVFYLNRLRSNFRRESEMKQQIQNGMTNQEFISQIRALTKERYQFGFLILRIIGDLACAMQKAQIPEKLLNTRFNRGLVALGGLMSSAIQIYLQATKEGKKNVCEV
ncbi:unnamed protein product [Paramecium sonneborni]|uniref:Uncharacterized protein n=1 Tax=Paramecium sonneborni TaxID=65129 RepID=A0A8S1KGL7_9CILI|nr:unnamed protein product [Paramecium sonneborni]